MPIQLTTPIAFKPAPAVPEEVYTQAKIVGYSGIIEPTDDAQLTMLVQFGNTVDDVWMPGLMEKQAVTIRDISEEYGQVPELDEEGEETGRAVPGIIREADPIYSDWVASTNPTSTENLLYSELAIAWYGWLIIQEGYEGDIV